MKRFVGLLVVFCMMFSFIPAMAAEITLPDGRKLNIDDLTQTEISQAIQTAQKSMKAKETAQDVLAVVKNTTPENLQAWANLITSTIKTICQDLSITVNDFVKTPVGLGISALIFYKVAGKELLENALDIAIMVPLWFLLTGIILFLGWYCYSGKTYYDSISYNEKGKKIRSGLKRMTRFPWDQRHGKETTNKEIFAWFLIIAELLGTVLTLLIVLC